MRYFGEFKKGTLTLGWGTAARHGYASCHGGLKRFTRRDGKKFVLAVFGLSGSGKSTITHATHGGKYDIMVLHDDAFVVNVREKYAIAMEPTYFDKLQDYPIGCEANKYLLTVQNCGVTRDAAGKRSPSPRTCATATAAPSSRACGRPTAWTASTNRSAPYAGS